MYDLKERSVYSKQEHLKLILSASILNGFATGVSNALGDSSPTGETLLSYIKTQKEEMLKSAFDRLVNENVRRLRRQRRFGMPLPVAVYLHDVMYYGDHDSTPMIIGTKHADGSNYAFEYLSASVLVDGERLIIAVLSLKTKEGCSFMYSTDYSKVKGGAQGKDSLSGLRRWILQHRYLEAIGAVQTEVHRSHRPNLQDKENEDLAWKEIHIYDERT